VHRGLVCLRLPAGRISAKNDHGHLVPSLDHLSRACLASCYTHWSVAQAILGAQLIKSDVYGMYCPFSSSPVTMQFGLMLAVGVDRVQWRRITDELPEIIPRGAPYWERYY
jgi:hypothetical protein